MMDSMATLVLVSTVVTTILRFGSWLENEVQISILQLPSGGPNCGETKTAFDTGDSEER